MWHNETYSNSETSVFLQLITVQSPSWESIQAHLARYSRQTETSEWVHVGDDIPVVLGASGLGWGRGVKPVEPSASDPIKKEGDGRSPAGAFEFGTAFGQTSLPSVPLALPYVFLSPSIECVDDEDSPHYNEIVNRNAVKTVDWKSSEKMASVDLYHIGAVIEHNANPPVHGAGSCIFMHIWRASNSGTSGCTAMAEQNLKQVLHWLDPKQKPELVQLTSAEYAHLKNQWNLP